MKFEKIKMKRQLLIFITCLLSVSSMADTLTIVNRFEKIEHASVLASYRNEFGSFIKPQLDVEFPYALIRVHIEGNKEAVTQAKEQFALYLGQHYTTKVKNTNHVNEIMFLVPVGAGHVELQCGDGCQPLTLFNYPQLAADAIYEGKVRYALEIKKGWDEPDPIAKQYFKFRIHPSDVAGITVLVTENGQQEPWNVADGIASRKLDYGVYHYVISADRYHKTEGSFTVSDTNNELDIHLRPQFGWLNVSGDNSAQGAYVFATNHSTGNVKQIGTIPLEKTELDAGAYSLRIQKTKYKDYLTTISIKEGETTTIRPVLEANFAQLTLAVQSGAEIWLEGNRLGTTSWTGTLELGEYVIEARQANHRSSYTQVVVSEQSVGKTIQLNNPKPIYGTFEVSGSPADATVYVDGKKAGTTPLLVNKILIGSHKIRIEKEGYDKQEKMLTISEGQEAVMDYTLMKEVKPVLNNTSTTYNDKKNGQEKGVVVPKFPNERIKIDSLYYQAVDDGTSVKVVAPGKYNFTGVDIPSKIKYMGYEYSVTKTGAMAFASCKNLTSITIPSSVTSIGYRAFYECKKLTSISIPNSVTSIGEGAFEGCDNLTSITIPNSVTSIGNKAFYGCYNLTSIVIPNSVTSIGGLVFWNCVNLTSITIPNSVTSIEFDAFHGCDNLTSITIPNSVTSIGEDAFHGCKNLKSITIPNSVTSIERGTFYSCENLTSITLPNSVTSIHKEAFLYCDKLKTIYIPRGRKGKFAAMWGLQDHVDKLVEQ